jgi:hypothetical protein
MSIKNLKINGVSSGERIASIGEYQKYMEEAQGIYHTLYNIYIIYIMYNKYIISYYK